MATSELRWCEGTSDLRFGDLSLGALRVRWDVVLVLLGVTVVSGLTNQDIVVGATVAGALGLAIVGHEFGHALARRAYGDKLSVHVQLTGAGSYLRGLSKGSERAVVLLAGPLFGLVTFGAGEALVRVFPHEYLAYLGGYLRYSAVLWSGYQLLPFPPLDGGLLFRRVVLDRVGCSATLAWRLCWALGFAAVVSIVLMTPALLEPVVWLTGMAVILGRAEAGYVRHVDAFEAWEQRDFPEVVRRVRALPDYLDASDQVALLELGVAAALELEDASGVEDLAAKLPAAHPSCVRAAEWLLRRQRAFGARLAEQALDALDADKVEPAQVDPEAWADLSFRLAIHEAGVLEDQSALGLLERAISLGFDDVDRLEAEVAFDRVREAPRMAALIRKLRSSG